jgi:hypothetical protein
LLITLCVLFNGYLLQLFCEFWPNVTCVSSMLVVDYPLGRQNTEGNQQCVI